MIDWGGLVFNALWVLGCALGLAVVSYASWDGVVSGEGLRKRLGRKAAQAWLDLAAVLFCAGLAGTAGRVWETGLWAVLGLAFGVQLGLAWRGAIKERV